MSATRNAEASSSTSEQPLANQDTAHLFDPLLTRCGSIPEICVFFFPAHPEKSFFSNRRLEGRIHRHQLYKVGSARIQTLGRRGEEFDGS